MTSRTFMRQAETFYRNYVLYCMYSPFTKITYVLSFPPTSLKQFLRAILSAACQAAVISSVQINSVTQLCLNLCDAMDCSMPGFPVHHQLPELTQTHVHWVGDAIQPTHPLLSPTPPVFNLSLHQGNESVLFKWVSSSHQVAEALEFKFQHQSFQWIFRTDFLLDGLVGSPFSPRDSQESSPTPQF